MIETSHEVPGTIYLKNFLEPASIGALLSRENGEKLSARMASALDEFEKKFDVVTIEFPKTVQAMGKTFFLGWLGDRVQKLKKDGFKKKFIFNADARIVGLIDKDYIRAAATVLNTTTARNKPREKNRHKFLFTILPGSLSGYAGIFLFSGGAQSLLIWAEKGILTLSGVGSKVIRNEIFNSAGKGLSGLKPERSLVLHIYPIPLATGKSHSRSS